MSNVIDEKPVLFNDFEDSERTPEPIKTFAPEQTQGVVPATVPISPRAEIALSDKGIALPKSMEEEFRLAKAYLTGGLLPKHYTKPEQIMTAIQFARELGLKPLSALSEIAIINGKPVLYGTLPLALVYRSGFLESIEEVYVDAKGMQIGVEDSATEIFGAVCRVRRKGMPSPKVTYFTLDDAKKANLFKNEVWKMYTRRMLQCRARAQALKDLFPDALNGAGLEGYDDVDTDSLSSSSDKATELNSMFSSGVEAITSARTQGAG